MFLPNSWEIQMETSSFQEAAPRKSDQLGSTQTLCTNPVKYTLPWGPSQLSFWYTRTFECCCRGTFSKWFQKAALVWAIFNKIQITGLRITGKTTPGNISQLDLSPLPSGLTPSFFPSFLLDSPLSLSILPSLLSSAFPWLTWSHSSRFIGSGGELGPFWRHFERYRVSSMFCVSLKSTTTTTTDHDHPPRWLGFKFLMITGGRAPCPSTPPSSLPSALSLLDILLPVFSVVALFITDVPRRPWSIHRSQECTDLPLKKRTSVQTVRMTNDQPTRVREAGHATRDNTKAIVCFQSCSHQFVSAMGTFANTTIMHIWMKMKRFEKLSKSAR